MKKTTGIDRAARRRRVDRAVPRARQPPAAPGRVRRGAGRCRPRPRSSTPTGPSSGPTPGSRASAPRPPACRCSTAATPRPTRTSPRCGSRAFVYLADGSPLHLRSVLKGSALFDALLYALRPGRGDRGVGRGRDRRVRPDGRPARRRVHRRARHRAGRRGLPRPRAARPTTGASARSSSSPPTRCSSASTSRPRSCARRRASGT